VPSTEKRGKYKHRWRHQLRARLEQLHRGCLRFRAESPSIFGGAVYLRRKTRVCSWPVPDLLTVRSCANWPRRTRSRPHRRAHGNYRARACMRSPSCKRSTETSKKRRVMHNGRRAITVSVLLTIQEYPDPTAPIPRSLALS